MSLTNLEFFLKRLRALPVCRSASVEGGFCLSTRSAFASENWVFASPTASAAHQALSFFRKEGVPFVWPLKPDADGGPLRRAGLREAGRLLAMAREPSAENRPANLRFHPVESLPDARRWADVVYRGFDEEGAPESFLRLAEAMKGDPALLMATARSGDKDVGTFLLAKDKGETGVYYFAVPPAFRRRGVASAMMGEICRLSGGKPIVLQATPAGVPFYRSAGFLSLFELPLYSTSEDVF